MKDNNPTDKHQNPGLNDLISLIEAAEYSGLSADHLRRLVRQREIWGKKFGRDWVTTIQAVKDYISLGKKPGPKSKVSTQKK